MERSKKVKVDMNPKRVKDPNEGNKRSPGKFDQKVYMEQESFSSNAIREMARIHAMQVHSINHKYEKDMVEIRKKKKHLDNKCTNYSYLKQLRQAFNEENERREILAFKMEEFARKQANPSPVREATPKPELPEKNYKPWEKTQQKQQAEPEKPAEIERKESDGFNFTKELESLESSLRLPPIDDKLNTPERVKLEALSKDIMTATLPIERLRRLMPSEEQGSSSRYPIMSKYRRNNVLPDVKKFKRRMTHDTLYLHHKINQYFGTHLSLSAYIIPKSAKPHKQKLLKAISTENFTLPHIPPELR